jgi:hypothetical protein
MEYYVSELDYRWPYSILSILFKHFGLRVTKEFNIIWFSNLSTLSVPEVTPEARRAH